MAFTYGGVRVPNGVHFSRCSTTTATTYWTVSVWTYGTTEIQFEVLKSRRPFDDEAKRVELRERFNSVPGINIPEDGISRRPSIGLATLTDNNVLTQFLAVLEWMISEIKKESHSDQAEG